MEAQTYKGRFGSGSFYRQIKQKILGFFIWTFQQFNKAVRLKQVQVTGLNRSCAALACFQGTFDLDIIKVKENKT